MKVPPAAPGPSGTSRDPAAERVTIFGRSSTAVVPPFCATWTFTVPAAACSVVSEAAVRPTLLRDPNTHSAMCAKKARV